MGVQNASSRRRVVIIGAGFGGLNTAKRLAGSDVEVTIVDRNNFHTFQPLLYQVATSGLNAADVAYAIRGIFHDAPNVSFRRGTVTGVDWAASTVALDGEEPLAFDHLVVAAGSSTNYFGVEGAEEHALPLYSLADATRIRNHVLTCFERADADHALVDRGILNFVVVGGGPTGVEVAGALVELIDCVLEHDYHSLDVDRARVVLVERLDRLLPPFSPSSSSYAQWVLSQRGVDVRLGATVERVADDHVVLDGERLDTYSLIWGAGVRANPVADVLAVEQNRAGRILVTPQLRVPEHPEAFAVGDVASIGSDDHELPQVAQVAIQSGRFVADVILGHHAEDTAFAYVDKGTMATIGRRAAVAELRGVGLKGGVAWLAWLLLHLLYLLGMRNRLSVLVNWAWNYVTWDRGPRLIFEPIPDTDELTRDPDA